MSHFYIREGSLQEIPNLKTLNEPIKTKTHTQKNPTKPKNPRHNTKKKQRKKKPTTLERQIWIIKIQIQNIYFEVLNRGLLQLLISLTLKWLPTYKKCGRIFINFLNYYLIHILSLL